MKLQKNDCVLKMDNGECGCYLYFKCGDVAESVCHSIMTAYARGQSDAYINVIQRLKEININDGNRKTNTVGSSC